MLTIFVRLLWHDTLQNECGMSSNNIDRQLGPYHIHHIVCSLQWTVWM